MARRKSDPAPPQRWLDARLEALRIEGKSKIGLARHLGIAAPRISEMITGQRKIFVTEINRMAAYLDMTIEDVILQIEAAEGDALMLAQASREAATSSGMMPHGSGPATLPRSEVEYDPEEFLVEALDCHRAGRIAHAAARCKAYIANVEGEKPPPRRRRQST